MYSSFHDKRNKTLHKITSPEDLSYLLVQIWMASLVIRTLYAPLECRLHKHFPLWRRRAH